MNLPKRQPARALAPIKRAPVARPIRTPAKPFFNLVTHDLSKVVPLLALCAGYERGQWRAGALAEHLMGFIAEFALTGDEWRNMDGRSARRMLRRAARSIYTTKKYENRGEVGELLLHAIMREYYGTEPLVSKFYFKDAANDTVKGFDLTHIVLGDGEDDVELWFGEAKLYSDINVAIQRVCEDLDRHTTTNFLRDEFMWLENKLPNSTPRLIRVRTLLNEATSLDEVFSVFHIPVLIGYESNTVREFTRRSDEYNAAITAEVKRLHATFAAKNRLREITVHLCLVPLGNKQKLLQEFDVRLRGQQQ